MNAGIASRSVGESWYLCSGSGSEDDAPPHMGLVLTGMVTTFYI